MQGVMLPVVQKEAVYSMGCRLLLTGVLCTYF